MIRGLNTNIKRNGLIYHIQTEDSGVRSALITAHLFLDGAVLAAVKTDYSDISSLPEDVLVSEVAERMRKAHRQMITRLSSGDFDEKKKSLPNDVLAESIVVDDDSSVADEAASEALPTTESLPENMRASDFQALLEYDDDDDDDEDSHIVDISLEKAEKKSFAYKSETAPVEDDSEGRTSFTPPANMSRAERISSVLARFYEAVPARDFSVSARIRQLLDGDEA